MPRTKHFESEKIPGASFDLLIIGRGVRHRAELQLADQRLEQRLIAQRKISLCPELEKAEAEPTKFEKAFEALKPAERSQFEALSIHEELLNEEVYFAYVRTLLVKFTLPGEEYEGITTTDELIESGPLFFVDEVIAKAMLMWRLSSEEIKNSERPSTSAVPVDGPSLDTTADSASNDKTTEPETVS